MINFLFWLGIAIAALGIFFLSPLADVLPIDPWSTIKNILGIQSPTQYYRAVPGENANVFSIALLVLGIALVGLSYYLKSGTSE